MAGPRVGPPVLVGLVLVLVLVLAGAGRTTGAVFSDTATTTTGAVSTGSNVAPPANPLQCSTFGPVLTPNANLRITTPLVAAPARVTVEYVIRIFRVDVDPPAQIDRTRLMTPGATTATQEYTSTLLTLLSTARYQARVTTRLAGQDRESSPLASTDFTIGGVLLNSFRCEA